MDEQIYESIKNTYKKSMMDIFVVLELDIKDKYKQYGIDNCGDCKKLAQKLLTDIVNEQYL